MSPENKILAEKIIIRLQKSQNGILSKMAILKEFTISINKLQPILLSLSDDFDLIKITNENDIRLTAKGWKFKTFDQLEKDSKKTPLTLFQKLQLFTTILSISVAVTFGILNYLLSSQKSELQDENNLLKTDLVRYKDSINVYKQKALLEKHSIDQDTSQTKN